MSRRQKEPLRVLTGEERQWLQQIARSRQEPTSHVIRAQQLLAVAAGQSYTKAAQGTGRKSGDAVSHLVTRCNQEGLQAVAPRASSGRKPSYGAPEREQILAVARYSPDPARDGAVTWSFKASPASLTAYGSSTLWTNQYLHDSGRVAGGRLSVGTESELVRDGTGIAQTQAGRGVGYRSGY